MRNAVRVQNAAGMTWQFRFAAVLMVCISTLAAILRRNGAGIVVSRSSLVDQGQLTATALPLYDHVDEIQKSPKHWFIHSCSIGVPIRMSAFRSSRENASAVAKYATMESAQVNAKDSAQMAATLMVSEATLAWHISCLGCQCKDCQQFVWRCCDSRSVALSGKPCGRQYAKRFT